MKYLNINKCIKSFTALKCLFKQNDLICYKLNQFSVLF